MKHFKISTSSLLGAGLGWWFLGPVGAVLGFVVGTIADNVSPEFGGNAEYQGGNPRDGFIASLLVLIAAVMKADGKVVKSELDYVKVYLVRSLGEAKSAEALIMLRDILKRNIPVSQVCGQIKNHVDYNSRVQLVHMLFGVANSDGSIPQSEVSVIQQIAFGLGLSTPDLQSLLNMYVKNTESAYKVLDVDPKAADDEIKKAYRRMALKFHPDKVAHLGEEFQEAAKEKFQKVNEAFESIKKERGFN
ncbi:TerB family tellurite resistance protein [Plebeiibacterium marinum]|uniref:TerB family tellurite resistance protein n=1 Tax=Plebeiibacterium marinum TaxID=2992111 RepID=A0AAE3MFF0_9BACT|nr:TerB family tellurite resistance protein [Plebeiobacterium marinum]MCW3806592.1 TerB family tellurite resistance protein [Plebeiobacterium marinum]